MCGAGSSGPAPAARSGTGAAVRSRQALGVQLAGVDEALAAYQTAIAITSTLVKVADVTSPATTTTTDVRGYIIVGQTDNAKRLVVNYALPALASGPTATRAGAVGVTQNLS